MAHAFRQDKPRAQITGNWSTRKSSDRWTVPIGGGVGKLFKIGNQPINSRI
jgi:hypothetical protein